MNIETASVTAPVPVTILTTHGDIDGSNYQELIMTGQRLCKAGMTNLLIDMGDTKYMSSSGLVALHSIAMLLKGEQPLNVDDGWNALRDMAEGPGETQQHLKLLNIPPRVDHLLEISGLKEVYQVFTDREAALASFGG